MQTLTLAIQDDVIDKVLSLLSNFSQTEVQVLKQSQPVDIFDQTSGILENRIADPVEWQRQMRTEEWA